GKVMDLNTNARPENLEIVAKEGKLPVETSQPFDRENIPKDLDVSPNAAKVIFQLTPEDPISPLIGGRDAVYILALKKTLPSEAPVFESVRDKVTADYKYTEALKLARKAGADFDKLLTNGLAQGKTFDALCAEAKVKPTAL